MGSRKKTPPISTWLNKPVDSILAHVGKAWDDNTIFDKALSIGLIGLGARAGWRMTPTVEAAAMGALSGLIGMRLAQTEGSSSFGVKLLGTEIDIPVNSQTVGLMILAGLGLINLPWEGASQFFIPATREIELPKPGTDSHVEGLVGSEKYEDLYYEAGGKARIVEGILPIHAWLQPAVDWWVQNFPFTR